MGWHVLRDRIVNYVGYSRNRVYFPLMRRALPNLALAMLLLAPVLQAQTDPAASPAENVQPTPAEDTAEGQRLLASRGTADLLAARQRFERAIAGDAKLAPAFAGLAETRALLFDYPGAKEAAEQALALDDHLAAAHAVLAFVRLHKDWDWAGAEAAFQRSLELEPGRAGTHLWRAILLEVTGHAEEAVAEARRAVELAPGRVHVRAGLGFRLFWARRYDEAVKELEAVLKMDPTYETAHYFIGRARVQQRKLDQAQVSYARARKLSPKDANLLSAQGYLDARAGRRDAARKVLTQLERFAAGDLPFASQIAAIHTALGEKEPALEWLQRSFLAHEGALTWIKIDPRFDALHGDSRFKEIVRKMGLEAPVSAGGEAR